MTMNPGIYENLSNEEYHADSAISRSDIMDFRRSPKRYWANKLSTVKPHKKSSSQMELGTAFHMAILEKELFDSTYRVETERVLLKDVGRERYDKYKEELLSLENSGKKIIPSEIYSSISYMKDSLNDHPQATKLIEEGKYENSLFWQDSISGLMVKSRPDIIHDDYIVDLKTVADASTSYIQKSIAIGGYHIQAAMVIDGINALTNKQMDTVIYVCVENTYPYGVGVYILDSESIQRGREEYLHALQRINNCHDKNEWKDYETQIVGLPRWYL